MVMAEKSYDQRIVESGRSRKAGIATRIGSAVMAGLGGYAATRHGIDFEISGWTLAGVSSLAGGTIGLRLGIERAAAKFRYKLAESYENQEYYSAAIQRQSSERSFVAEASSSVFSAITGNTIPSGTIPSEAHLPGPAAGWAVMAGAAVLATEALIRVAGETNSDTPPWLHDRLHLIRETTRAAEPSSPQTGPNQT
jgi:hypothetical protein